MAKILNFASPFNCHLGVRWNCWNCKKLQKQRDILRFGKEGMPLCTKYQGYFFLVTKEENGISQNYSKMFSFKSDIRSLKKRRQLSEEKWYSKISKEVRTSGWQQKNVKKRWRIKLVFAVVEEKELVNKRKIVVLPSSLVQDFIRERNIEKMSNMHDYVSANLHLLITR